MKRRTHLLVSAAALLLLTFGWPSSAGAQQYQFGYLSYRQALQAMPEYTAAQQSLSALKTKYDDEAKYNEEKFRKMFADFLEGQKGFPQEIMLKRQKELQVAMEQGISFRKDAERLLSKAEDELMKPIVSKLDSTLALIGQENGLIFIINTDNRDFPFIHTQAGKDLSDIVKARLEGRVVPVNVKPQPDPAATATPNRTTTPGPDPTAARTE
jgi:outer membrane protein